MADTRISPGSPGGGGLTTGGRSGQSGGGPGGNVPPVGIYNPPPAGPAPDPWPVPIVPGSTETANQQPRSDAALAQGACIPVVYGTCYVPPDIFFGHVQVQDPNNVTGWFGLGFSHGPIESFYSWETSKDTHIGTISGVLAVRCERLGSLTQNKIGVGDADPGAHGVQFGLDHGSLPGLAYVYAETVNNGIVVPSAIVKGIRCYDPRLGTWPPATEDPPDAYRQTTATTNPALQMADLLTNSHYGCGIWATTVDWASVIDAANYCDEIVDGAKRFECHIILDHRDDANAWFKTIGLHFGGAWQQREGLWYLYVHKPIATVDSYITADHFVSSPRLSRQTGAGLADLPNRVTVEWTDPADVWLTKTVSVSQTSVELGETVREGSPYQLLGCHSEKQAYRSAWYLLNMMSADLTLNGTLMPSQLHLRVGSRINVIDASVGMPSPGQDFIVTQMGRNADDTVSFQATEYSPDIWNPSSYTPASPPGGPITEVYNPYDVVGATMVTLSNGATGLYWSPPIIKTTALYGASKWSVQHAVAGYDLSLLNNGLDTAVALSFSSADPDPRNVALDLGAGVSTAFKGVRRTVSAKDNILAWDIHFSDDGSSWTKLTGGSHGLTNVARVQLPSGYWVEEWTWNDSLAGAHRYWKMEVGAGSPGTGTVSIRELQWWSSGGSYQYIQGYELHLGPAASGRLLAMIPVAAAPTATTPLDVEPYWTTDDTVYTEDGISSPFYNRIIQRIQVVVVTVSSLNQKSSGMGISFIRDPSTVSGLTSMAGKFRSSAKSSLVLPALSAAHEGKMEFYADKYMMSENAGPFAPIMSDGGATPGVKLQGSTPGTEQTGHARLSGTVLSGRLGKTGGASTFVLPSADGASGDALVTDGAGNLSFAKAGELISGTRTLGAALGSTVELCLLGCSSGAMTLVIEVVAEASGIANPKSFGAMPTYWGSAGSSAWFSVAVISQRPVTANEFELDLSNENYNQTRLRLRRVATDGITAMTCLFRVSGRLGASPSVAAASAGGSGGVISGCHNAGVPSPCGAIQMWGSDTMPSGWLQCDGSEISRVTYSRLFAILGTGYGVGNGSTTFNIPDLRQRFPLGKSGSGPKWPSGSPSGLTLGEMGGNIDHTHTVDPGPVASGARNPTGAMNIAAGTTQFLDHTHSVDIPATTSSIANPPYNTVHYILRY